MADLPQIGKWMVALDGKPACWLNQTYQGKRLREPVNIVILDLISGTAKEANLKVLKACGQAGYKDRLERLKSGENQGRISGPYYFHGYYYFIGSFRGTRARDDFAKQLEKKSRFKVAGFVNLDNMIIDNPNLTTGDHDGVAVLLTLR